MQTSRIAAALLLGLVAAAPACADESASAEPVRGEDAQPPVAPPATAPRWTAGGALQPDGYRMSVSRGSIDLGMRFEPRFVPLRPTETRSEPATVTLPAVSLELRSVSPGPAMASSLAARALGTADDTATVSKVGIEWKPAQSQIFFRGGVGVRLSGDDSVVMRLRKGTLGVYMQRRF
jgi:hypothetical protein